MINVAAASTLASHTSRGSAFLVFITLGTFNLCANG
jgi:hypothetical protein